MATFTATSTPELDALLSSFRSKVFIPAHLPRRQKGLIYKQKYKPMLEADPVFIEVGKEKVQLFHIDRVKDEPSTRKGVEKMLELMKDKRDWENLPLLLAELKIAKRKSVPPVEKLVRRANEAGMQHVVLECVKRTKETGMTLTSLDVVREVMWGAHLRGHRAGWDERVTERALKYAENVSFLLEKQLHTRGGGQEVSQQPDPRTQPDVVGVLLETAAIRALKHQGGQDKDGKVAQYAERLMECWENVTLDSTEDQSSTRAQNGGDDDSTRAKATPLWVAANYDLQRWSPVWKGMEIAARILDPKTEVARWLKKTLPDVENVLQRACELVERSHVGKPEVRRRGLEWYHDMRKI